LFPVLGAGDGRNDAESSRETTELAPDRIGFVQFVASGQTAPVGKETNERCEGVLMSFVEFLADPGLWWSAALTNSAGEQLVSLRRVAEHVHDSRCCRHGHGIQNLFDPRSEFVLCIEFLERAGAGDDAVAGGTPAQATCIPDEACRDHEEFAGEVPCLPENLCSFDYVFDDVEDIAEVHHGGRGARPIGPVGRIPSVRWDA
jgi:hypothetical protein